jgi:hypothetical protein
VPHLMIPPAASSPMIVCISLWHEKPVADAYLQAALASDPTSASRTPVSFRSPGGVGMPSYKHGRCSSPTIGPGDNDSANDSCMTGLYMSIDPVPSSSLQATAASVGRWQRCEGWGGSHKIREHDQWTIAVSRPAWHGCEREGP